MTTEPTAPKSAGTFSWSVLFAGLLGGLLGAVCSFVLARTLPAPVPAPPTPPPSEARRFAEEVLATLKAGKQDDFAALLRPAFAEASDEEFAVVRTQMAEARAKDAERLGGASEFEYCRETALSPSLTRVVFIEKYPRGVMVWSMVVYRGADRWMVLSCDLRAPGRATGAPL